jgi:hypothetical protein
MVAPSVFLIGRKRGKEHDWPYMYSKIVYKTIIIGFFVFSFLQVLETRPRDSTSDLPIRKASKGTQLTFKRESHRSIGICTNITFLGLTVGVVPLQNLYSGNFN